MIESDNYRKAIAASHRLLVGACVLVFGLALYLFHTLYLDLANVQLVQLENFERTQLSFYLEFFYRRALRSKLSAASRRVLLLDQSGSLAVWVTNQPITNGNPALLELHDTIGKLLAANFPYADLSFANATLQQIHDALQTLIFIPDLTADKYARLLDQCIRETAFKANSVSPFVIVTIIHNQPTDDVEIPGHFHGHATVSVSPTSHGVRPCFSIDEFAPYSASELLAAALPSLSHGDGLLPIFQRDPLPDLETGGTWEAVRDLTVAEAENEIRKMSLSGRPNIPMIGTSISSETLAIAAPLVILLLQMVLLGHISAALKNPRVRRSAAEWAWTGIYPGPSSTLLMVASTTMIPLCVTLSLWWVTSQTLLVTDAGIFGAGILRGMFQIPVAVVILAIGLRIVFCLRDLREA